MANTQSWKFIEANLEELILMSQHENEAAEVYRQGIIAFLKSDLAELEACAEVLETKSPIAVCLQLRLQIKRGNLNKTFLEEIERAAHFYEDIWHGEALFLIGQAYYILKTFDLSQKAYVHAFRSFEKAGLAKKSVKALLNSVAAESCYSPQKRLLVEYQMIARKAIQVGEFAAAGTAVMNISREFHLIRSFELSLRYANQSLQYFAQGDYGSLGYFLALLHKAHLLLDMSRSSESLLCYEEARAATQPEVRSSILILSQMYESRLGIKVETSQLIDLEKSLPATWQERAKAGQVQSLLQKMSGDEAKLIETLSESGRDRNELLSILYGDVVDFDSLIGRFKNLLSRVRKKHPDLIVFENGVYKLSEAEKTYGT